jgi:hypothetical protein
MSVATDREHLIDDILRLRRAERLSPAHDDIAAVQANLERMVGPTVTRAMAARLLGVSQTALDRWAATGDVPVVIARSGHRETPLHALVELIEAVRERRFTNPADRHPLGSVLRKRRAQADLLTTSTLLRTADRRRRGADGHRPAELRSLAYHRAVAQRLDEAIVQDARRRLARWRTQGRINPRYAQQWEGILGDTPSRIARRIARDTPHMRDLRQNSPFAGTLSEPERRRVLAAVGPKPHET